MSLHERIRSVGIRLGAMAGRVNPDDWREISILRDELAGYANEAEWLENLRDSEIAAATGSVDEAPQGETITAEGETQPEAAQPTNRRRGGNAAKESS